MEVDEANGRQWLGRLVEQAIGIGERVLDGLHEGPTLEVDHGDVGAIHRLVGAPTAAGDVVRAVVEGTQNAIVRLEERVDLALVPDVVAGRDDVHAVRQERLGGRRGEAHAAGHVLAVGRDEVDAAFVAQSGQERLHGRPSGLADEIADHQDATGPRRAGRIPVGGIAESGLPDRPDVGRGIAVGHCGYFANSTARVSRMTVTLIWPG